MSKTHWKANFDYDYLGSQDFEPGQDKTVTIKTIANEEVTGANGRKEECVVAHFEEGLKPMILNRTNCKIIAKIYKSPYIEDWVGKSIQLYVDPAVRFGSEVVEGLRVRPMQPKPVQSKAKPVLSADDAEKWSKAVEFVKEKGFPELEKFYVVSAEVKKLIEEEVVK